jgi:hypothetical protein
VKSTTRSSHLKIVVRPASAPCRLLFAAGVLALANMLVAISSLSHAAAQSVQTGRGIFDAPGFQLQATPLSNADALQELSGLDLGSRGMFAIRMAIRNRGRQAVTLDIDDNVALILPDGQQLKRTAQWDIVSLFTAEYRKPTAKLHGLLGGFGGMIENAAKDSSRKAYDAANASVFDKVSKKYLRTSELQPGETGEGLVFFTVPPGSARFTSAELSFVIDLPADAKVAGKMRLDNIDFPAPAATVEPPSGDSAQPGRSGGRRKQY